MISSDQLMSLSALCLQGVTVQMYHHVRYRVSLRHDLGYHLLNGECRNPMIIKSSIERGYGGKSFNPLRKNVVYLLTLCLTSSFPVFASYVRDTALNQKTIMRNLTLIMHGRNVQQKRHILHTNALWWVRFKRSTWSCALTIYHYRS